MIARYARREMQGIWSERSKYETWLEVEMAVCEQLCRDGKIPKKDWQKLKGRCLDVLHNHRLDPKRIEEVERVTRHDVIAFTTVLAELVGPLSRYIHFGLTSSDVLDTALSLQIQKAGKRLVVGIDELLNVLRRKAVQFKKLATIGRSHGIFAEPTSFGMKFLSWHCEWKRNRYRVVRALENLAVGKLSGAVGVEPHWSTDFEIKALRNLELEPELVATQVVARDRHAEFISSLALCGSSLERIAIELRHLQRSEVGEVQESFHKGQKGSSAMPHKRNPISSENITGCARLLRSYVQSALENIALWHERDISHSAVERVIFPDSTILLDYALNRMHGILDKLVVIENNVAKNLRWAGSIVYSGHYLLELVKKGVSREDAYRWVQECALASLKEQEQKGERDETLEEESGAFESSRPGPSGSFIKRLVEHPEIRSRISEKRIRELGSIKYQIRNVGRIYERAFEKD